MKQSWMTKTGIGLSAAVLIVGMPGRAGAEDAPAGRTPAVTQAGSPPSAPGGMTHQSGSSIEATSLEDLMLEKGLITMDDWIRIKAEEERRFSERQVIAEFTGSPRWYERITMFGYGMLRYNPTLSTSKPISNYHDRFVGDDAAFGFRRIRLVFAGQVSEHVSVFFQPDMATNLSSNAFVLSMRDAFGDYTFDRDREFKVRLGLQRVPCSFDNWQASRVRMAIDRADATNSCQSSERDTGASFMWSPKHAQARFKQMLDYMYGAGDYGVLGVWVYNGQGATANEANADKHVAVRLAYPFELPGGRLMEAGINANRGMFNVAMGTAANGTALYSFNQSGTTAARNYRDERVNAYLYLPPQPWGFIAEGVVGRGPERDGRGVVRDRALNGGYAQLHYQWKYSDTALANFYSRYQYYNGGIKFLAGAPSDRGMQEVEAGIAWQPDPQWEFTLAYTFAHRPNTSLSNLSTAAVPGNQFTADANLLRMQMIWFWN